MGEKKRKNKSFKENHLEEFNHIKVADMNVEGMPWYKERTVIEEENQQPKVEWSKRDMRRYIVASTLAGLAIAGIFVLGMLLFLLFCVFVWFR